MGGRPLGGGQEEACLLRVKVKPGSRRPGLARGPDGAVVARVSAPASEGRANGELAERLGLLFGVAVSRVEVVHGKTSRDKLIRVTGVGAGRFKQALESLEMT